MIVINLGQEKLKIIQTDEELYETFLRVSADVKNNITTLKSLDDCMSSADLKHSGIYDPKAYQQSLKEILSLCNAIEEYIHYHNLTLDEDVTKFIRKETASKKLLLEKGVSNCNKYSIDDSVMGL